MPAEIEHEDLIDFQTLGKAAYDAYRKQSGGRSLISGQPIPDFGVLPDRIQNAWVHAAIAVARQMNGIYERAVARIGGTAKIEFTEVNGEAD